MSSQKQILKNVYKLDDILAHRAIKIIDNINLHHVDFSAPTNDYSTLSSNEHLNELLLIQYLKKLSTHLDLYNSNCSKQAQNYFTDVVMLDIYQNKFSHAVAMLKQFELQK